MCIYQAYTATIFNKYCKSQFLYTVHLITVTDRSPYSECRFQWNIKALLDKWSQSTVEIFFFWRYHWWSGLGRFSSTVSTDSFYMEHDVCSITYLFLKSPVCTLSYQLTGKHNNKFKNDYTRTLCAYMFKHTAKVYSHIWLWPVFQAFWMWLPGTEG